MDIKTCLVLPDGKFMILVLNNNKTQLLLFNNEGIFIDHKVTFRGYPHDACFVRNNTVAVTFGRANTTAVVDIQKKKVIKTIKLFHNCHNVASDGKTLVIGSGHSQITRVNLNER